MGHWWTTWATNYLRRRGYVVLYPGWRGIAVGDCVVTGRYDLMTVIPSHNRSIGHVINLSGSVIDLEGEPQST
jgi:hypothetical protein